MRDLHLRHTLKLLARDASAAFADLVEQGQEIPYEIAEPGEAFAFCHYRPLTAKFVRDNSAELRELDSFAEAVETMRRSELAATYLEEAGIAPPADPSERATLALTYFLARLWDGCSDFELEEERFVTALEEVEACAEPEPGEIEAIVPLIGLQAPVARIELKGAAIVRADTVDVPPEAAQGDRPAPGSWEPSFLISARVPVDPERGIGGSGERVAAVFERVVTTLRLFKPGSVGLGPHGWVRVAGDRWRRISTGAGRPRAGGYRLTEEEVSGLVDLARTIAVHPKRLGRLRRALMRFESGLDRRGAVDALNDHLLGLRFLLEGEGLAGAGLSMRAAAIAADPEHRDETRRLIEDGMRMERELWSGEPSRLGVSPSEVALGIEDLLRAILRRGVSGELGSDLRAAADETLLGDGLALGAGSGQLGDEAEWEPVEEHEEASEAPRLEAAAAPETTEIEEVSEAEAFQRFESDTDATIVASRGSEPRLQPAPEPAPEAVPAAVGAEAGAEEPDESALPDWMEEVEEGDATMDFPAQPAHLKDLAKSPLDREEVRARVEYLFPRTETDWSVGQGEGRAQAS